MVSNIQRPVLRATGGGSDPFSTASIATEQDRWFASSQGGCAGDRIAGDTRLLFQPQTRRAAHRPIGANSRRDTGIYSARLNGKTQVLKSQRRDSPGECEKGRRVAARLSIRKQIDLDQVSNLAWRDRSAGCLRLTLALDVDLGRLHAHAPCRRQRGIEEHFKAPPIRRLRCACRGRPSAPDHSSAWEGFRDRSTHPKPCSYPRSRPCRGARSVP